MSSEDFFVKMYGFQPTKSPTKSPTSTRFDIVGPIDDELSVTTGVERFDMYKDYKLVGYATSRQARDAICRLIGV